MTTVTREQLQSIEWVGPLRVLETDRTCVVCRRSKLEGHALDCWLAAALASPPAEDCGVMVRVDAMLVEQMRAGGLQGPFSRVDLDETGTEPRLMLTVQREPTPDSVEWWRSVAAGLGVEIQKLKDLAAQAPPASDPPGLVANWRPIETAPKRTDVLAGWADRPHWLPQVLQQDDAGMWFNGEESDYRPPTHWMPLPASPQAETKGDE